MLNLSLLLLYLKIFLWFENLKSIAVHCIPHIGDKFSLSEAGYNIKFLFNPVAIILTLPSSSTSIGVSLSLGDSPPDPFACKSFESCSLSESWLEETCALELLTLIPCARASRAAVKKYYADNINKFFLKRKLK